MDFAPLDSGNLLTKLEFIHSAPEENSRYMVRTYGLKQVYAGTFYTFSQGAFTAVNAATENDLSQDMSIHTPSGVPVRMPDVFSRVKSGKIYALIEGPACGALTFDGPDWIYAPPTGFSGTLTLRFSISDNLRTDETVLTIKIGG
jgi:hypothetical protein